MAKLQLTEEQLKQINLRRTALQLNTVLVQAAQRELHTYSLECLKELGLSDASEGKYKIDFKDGMVLEVSAKQVEIDTKDGSD